MPVRGAGIWAGIGAWAGIEASIPACRPRPGRVTMATAPPSRHAPAAARGVAMAAALGAMVAALESYRGRDRAVRALCYGCQLAGGALSGPQSPAEGLPGSLLALSAQLSSCRTVLRLLDDLAMLSHSRDYGLGPKVRAGREVRPKAACRASGCAAYQASGCAAYQASGVTLCPCASRRMRTLWSGCCRCFATWPTSCITPASTSHGRQTAASSAAALSAGGLPARRYGGCRCSWASCGERRPEERPMGSARLPAAAL
uniref:Peroxisomal biosis factor 11 gamma n=1 Tax=Coturnix japonica TaxID=93934 RepID=A0A8C2TIV3_COTJA